MPPGVLCGSQAKAGILVSRARVRKHPAVEVIEAFSGGPRIIRLILLTAALTAAAVLLGGEPARSQTRAPSPQLKGLSAQDVARFKQIIHGVIHNPGNLTPAVHGEFWRILAKTGATPQQAAAMREQMTGMLTVYYPMFWQDALDSLRHRRPYKSAQRQEYEKELLARRLITADKIKANDALIAGIASGQPVDRQGKRIVLNEQAIQASLKNVQDTAKRVDWLFTQGGR
ncbi:MAG: hypothetical protein V1792_15970 [Pseudomonadota bacterium]